MKVKMKSTSIIKAHLGIEEGGRVHKFFTAECARYMDRYVPFDTGVLAGTVIKGGEPTANVETTRIIYDTPYAKYVYKGITKSGKKMNYSKHTHSEAGDHWDRRMVTVHMKQIEKNVQNHIDRGK